MPVPSVTSRPEKTIDLIISKWNAANLPLQYEITNTKWPTNSDDTTYTITGISNDNGYAKVTISAASSFVAKEWVTISGTAAYDGIYRIRSVTSTTVFTIDTAYGATDTGSAQLYYNNYTTLIRVYAGIAPDHEYASEDAISLIGTLEVRPDTDNITYADVREFVKNKLNTNYDSTQSAWPNDLNAWTDFYIAVAERYDSVSGGSVIDYTSAYYNDEVAGEIVYLHAVNSALQFGDPNGGNMFDYVMFLNDVYTDDEVKFMTFFDRPKIYDYNTFNISVIIDAISYNQQIEFVIEEYDINDTLLATTEVPIPEQDYGVYRLAIEGIIFDDDTNYLNVYVQDA